MGEIYLMQKKKKSEQLEGQKLGGKILFHS